MQLTRIRIVSFALPLMLAAAACGQVTGLSNDYAFDVGDGGGTSTGDASGDASASDAPSSTDARADAADAAPKCSTAQSALATTRMSQFNGTQACKSCLAASCCTDVEACTSASDCKHTLQCHVECTPLTGTDRTDCFNNCANGGGSTPALYTNGIGACSASSCNAQCNFP